MTQNTTMKEINELTIKMAREYIGKTNSPALRKQLANAVGLSIKKFDGVKNVLVAPNIAWNLMSLKEKAIWFTANILFPSIGETIRKIHSKQQQDENAEKLPFWAFRDPKDVVILNLNICLTQPLQTIQLQIKTSEDSLPISSSE